MKLYNPFKAHIWHDGLGNYFIRKYDFLLDSWLYLDTHEHYWCWAPRNVWVKFNTAKEAKDRLAKYKTRGVV